MRAMKENFSSRTYYISIEWYSLRFGISSRSRGIPRFSKPYEVLRTEYSIPLANPNKMMERCNASLACLAHESF